MHPFLLLSATELASRIREGSVTSREVVDLSIERVESVNPRLNAMVADRFATARLEADEADRRIASGEADLPPLLGVPCSIKESFAVEGMPNSAGSVARRDVRAAKDATSVGRLRAAGAVPIGVSNTSELCMWMETSNRLYGRTRNPYDQRRTVGGSSGGEGAMVGSGAVPFGLGADVGGSIRMPAFFNGVFGHKPGSGVVPNTGQFPNAVPAASRFLATGPLCRRSADLMPLLRILAGPDGEDGACVAGPLGDAADVAIAGLSVLDVAGNGSISVQGSLRRAQEAAVAHLGSAGADVAQATFGQLAQSFDIWSSMLGHAEGRGSFLKLMGYSHRRQLLSHLFQAPLGRGPHTLPAIVLGLLEDTTHMSTRRLERFVSMGHELREQLIGAIGSGVMIYPSYPETAPRHGMPLVRPMRWVYTAIFNVMGFPVTQVPLGLDKQGLPMGVQIIGTPGHDHVTIAVAQELERGFGGWVPPGR